MGFDSECSACNGHPRSCHIIWLQPREVIQDIQWEHTCAASWSARAMAACASSPVTATMRLREEGCSHPSAISCAHRPWLPQA